MPILASEALQHENKRSSNKMPRSNTCLSGLTWHLNTHHLIFGLGFFHKHTTLAIISIMASEALLLCENKKFQWQNVTPVTFPIALRSWTIHSFQQAVKERDSSDTSQSSTSNHSISYMLIWRWILGLNKDEATPIYWGRSPKWIRVAEALFKLRIHWHRQHVTFLSHNLLKLTSHTRSGTKSNMATVA